MCAAPSNSFRHLQAVITAELRAYCKMLVAEQEAALNHLKVALDQRLKVDSEQREDFAKQLQNFEQKLQCLEGSLSNMDLRLAKTASQQALAHSELQTFENHATGVFQSFEESLQEIHRKLLQASIPQFKTLQEQTCRNLVVHGPKDGGGRLHPPSASSNAPPSTIGIEASLAPEQFPAREATLTVECLEVALASMQEHEHEQIRRLRERIRTPTSHGGFNSADLCPGNSG